MCITTITYLCHHRSEENIPCQAYQQRVREAQKSHRNPSFWKSLLCGAPSSSTRSVRCTQKPGKRSVYSKCPKCVDREQQERARVDRETEIRAMFARDAHNEREKQRLQERRRSDRKAAFRCSKCTAERRWPDQMSRAANEGLCCARGIDEFAELEKANGYRAQAPSKKTVADKPRKAPVPTREQRFPELSYMTSMEKVREDAKVAANTYGWDRRRQGSADLEPKLVSSYVNASGANPNILASAPPPAQKQPHFEELGIDYTVWRKMQDVKLGAHGRIPPAPDKPLPVRPLATKYPGQIPRKPLASRSDSSRLMVNTNVSLPSSRGSRGPRAPPSPVSPVSPRSKPKPKLQRSSASIMNGELYDMLDDSLAEWKQEPMPEPRYRY
ncbi:uncharacterized protein LY89DRAFT_788816 [Mollisia scopiformis]|uniref:Uncharacterized protein n=1 Tax=Mollisia scopiformis TaxID=149040 RepID=A0A132B8V9_MOLSC|nr:uncharacterized protein LY89DRAFT_788816 [Mollisia scopiformis]KUJ08429.1 hypothetical protein LY89DRAFT_788816 [Mollisia scopiformis]